MIYAQNGMKTPDNVFYAIEALLLKEENVLLIHLELI